MAMIVFSKHAKDKFLVFKIHGFPIAEEDVIKAIESHDSIEYGKKGRKICQKVLDEEHLLRVIYEEFCDKIVVITFYPARRRRYESKI